MHSWESTRGCWCCLCTLPSITVQQHIWLWDMSHLSSKEETTSLVYFLYLYFLSRNWLIKKPVWEKHMKILRQPF